MTKEQLLRLITKEGMRKSNAALARELLYGKDTLSQDALQDPQPERHQAPALDGPKKGAEEGVPRIRIRFTGRRVRPLDPDNFAGGCKDLLDGLRHAGLIPDDSPDKIQCVFDQEKVRSKDEEGTEIFLTLP